MTLETVTKTLKKKICNVLIYKYVILECLNIQKQPSSIPFSFIGLESSFYECLTSVGAD
jgi:hypothetical protein